MKVVQIPGLGPVSFPDNVPDQEVQTRSAALADAVQARAQQQKQEADARYAEYWKNQGIGSLASGGAHRAWTGLGSTITDLIPALVGAGLGFPEYAREQLREAEEKKKAAELAHPTAFKSYKDVSGIGQGLGFVAETAGEMLPDMLAMLTGAGAAGAIGRRAATAGAKSMAERVAAEYVAKKGLTGEAADQATATITRRLAQMGGQKGAERATLGGLYGSSIGLNAPDTFESIYEKTHSLEPGIALAYGAAQGVLDTYLPGKIMGQLSSAARDRLAAEIVSRSTVVPQSVKLGVLKKLGTTAAGEFTTEGSQELLGILAEQQAGAKGNLLDPENIDRMMNAAIKGLVGGTTFGAPGAVVEARRETALAKQEQAAREEAAQAKAAQAEQATQAARIGQGAGAERLNTLRARADEVADQIARVQATPPGEQIEMFPNELARAAQITQGPPAPPAAPPTEAAPTAPAGQMELGLETPEERVAREREEERQRVQLAEEERLKRELAEDQKRREKQQKGRPAQERRLTDVFGNAEYDMFGEPIPTERRNAPTGEAPAEAAAPTTPGEQLELGLETSADRIAREKRAAEELAADQKRREKQQKGHAERERRLTKTLGEAEYDMFGEPIPTERRNAPEEVAAEEEAPAGPDARQGALQFAPAEPEGLRNRQLADELAERRRLQEEDAAYEERERARREEEQRIEAERQVIANRAAAEEEYQRGQRGEEEARPEEPKGFQPSFPGMGTPYIRKLRVDEEVPEEVPTVTNELLDGLGVLPAAPVRRRIVGKDLGNPTHRDTVQQELSAYAANESVPAPTRERIREYLNTTPFLKQAEMFGPKGGPTRTATDQTAARKAEEEAKAQAEAEAKAREEKEAKARARAEAKADKERKAREEAEAKLEAERKAREEAEAKAEEERKAREEAEAKAEAEAEAEAEAAEAKAEEERKAKEPKKRKSTAKKAEPEGATNEPETVATAAPTAGESVSVSGEPAGGEATEGTGAPANGGVDVRTGGAGPTNERKRKQPPAVGGEAAFGETVGEVAGYYGASTRMALLPYNKEADLPAEDVSTVQTLIETDPRETDPDEKAAAVYFGKGQRPVDALLNIAFDLTFNPPKFRVEPGIDSPADIMLFSGTGGAVARRAENWIVATLSPEAVTRLEDMVLAYKDLKKRAALNNVLRVLGRELPPGVADETVTEYIEAQQAEAEAIPAATNRAERRSLARRGVTVEGEYTRIVMENVAELPSPDVVTLEKHYGAKKGSNKFLGRLLDDISRIATKGVKAVDKAVRDIVHVIYTGVLSVAMILNPLNISPAEKYIVVPQQAEAKVMTQEVRAEVPSDVKGMSDAGRQAYETLVPALKGKNGDKLIIIADKPSGRLFVFTSDGKLVVGKKTLFGLAKGDLYKGNNDLPQNRITPAGLFGLKLVDAATSPSAKKTAGEYDFGKVFALNDPDAVVTIMHSVWLHESDAQLRAAALKNEDAADSRYSFGCINVDKATYKMLLDNYQSQMDGAKMFVVPDNQQQVKEFLAGNVPDDKLVRESVSPLTASYTIPTTPIAASVQTRTAVAKEEESPAVARLDNAYLKLEDASDTIKLTKPLHPAAITALHNGNATEAIRRLAITTQGRVARAFAAMARAGVSPNVVVTENLVDENGRRVPGYYDPATNTVHLDAATGMNSHVILHEMGHAATAHVLANPNHPVTRQLTDLYNSVKDSLDTAYGAQSLEEFVAEAWSNPLFQEKLNSINPKGERITAWQRFANVVRNFFRRMMGLDTKGVDSALDAADQMINAILSPAPELRDSQVLYAATVEPRSPSISKFINGMTDAMQSMPVIGKYADSFNSLLRSRPKDTAVSVILSALPLQALTDAASKYLKNAPQVNTVVNQKAGDENIRNAKIEGIVMLVEKWAKANPTKVKVLDDLIAETTPTLDNGMLGVDPSKPRSTYEKAPARKEGQSAEDAMQAIRDQDAKLARWDALQPKWNSLGAEGRQTYRMMRDLYAALYNEIKTAIGAKIDEAAPDEETAKRMKTDIFAELAKRGDIDPFFPLHRKGDYWLSYTTKDSNGQPTVVVRAFEHQREREREIEALNEANKKTPGTITDIQPYTEISSLDYKDVPATSFVHGVLKVMDTNKVSGEAKEQVLRLFLSTLPESSFAQSFQKRKGTAGFTRDSIKVLRDRSYNLSRQLTNMKFASKLQLLKKDLREAVKAIGKGANAEDDRAAVAYLRELEKRIDFAISPKSNQVSQALSSLGFNYLLGFNVSSAVVNLAQVPLVVLPYLGGKYGYGESMRAIQDAYKTFGGSGFKRVMTQAVIKEGGNPVDVEAPAAFSIDNLNFKSGKLSKDLQSLETLVEVARNQGQLNRSMFYDVLAVDGSKNPWTVVNAMSGYAFHHAERMNREVTLVAAYKLELARLKKAGKTGKDAEIEAANTAIYTTETTNGGTTAASAPRIAQGDLGKVIFMFKRYGATMYYMLFKMTKEALSAKSYQIIDLEKQIAQAKKAATPDTAKIDALNAELKQAIADHAKVRKASWKQLGGIYGTAALFSGLQGLPLFGLAAMIYNMFCDDDDDDFGTVTRNATNEFMYKGALNYITGTDTASRTGLSDLLFRDNKLSAGSASLAQWVGETLGGPAYGIATKIERGTKMINEGNVERGIENLVPTALGNVMRGIRFGTEGANTLRGDPIVGDIGPWNAFAQLFGFAPAEYTKQLEINAHIKGVDKYVNERATKLRRMYNVARHTNDLDGMQDAREELVNLYAKHPGLGNLQESLTKSITAFDKATPKMYHGITLSPKLRNEMLERAREMED